MQLPTLISFQFHLSRLPLVPFRCRKVGALGVLTWALSSPTLPPPPENMGGVLTANPESGAEPRRPLCGESATEETI